MEIANDTVVSVYYTLKNDQGVVIDQAPEGKPLVYLQGHRNIIPGLESALVGKNVGDQLEVTVEPEQGYGPINPAMIQQVPREQFQGVESLEVGMQFQASTEQGPVPVVVTQVEEDTITVDGNHPLAGQNLNFSVTIDAIREATNEEKAQGHIQQESGCCGGGGGESGSSGSSEGGSCGCS
tara:strand:+ start:2096 stop:2638 length:543 start_codon:yes stop_codon:yes gene_type:complete